MHSRVDHGAHLLRCNLNSLHSEMDVTYPQFQPQWDSLQELSHDGSGAGWSCSPQTSPNQNMKQRRKEWGSGLSSRGIQLLSWNIWTQGNTYIRQKMQSQCLVFNAVYMSRRNSHRMSSLILFFCIAQFRADLAKLLIEDTQYFIQCSNITNYTNCLTWRSG